MQDDVEMQKIFYMLFLYLTYLKQKKKVTHFFIFNLNS